MSSGLVDIGLDTADSYARRGTAPRLKNKKKNRPIFFELLRLVFYSVNKYLTDNYK